MAVRTILGIGLLATAIVLSPLLAVSRNGGAPASNTGAPITDTFNESTCVTTACHDDGSLDAGPGRIVIEAPSTFIPGDSIEFVVRVEEEDRAVFGFQVAIKDASHAHAGRLLLLEPTVTRKVPVVAGIDDYVTHNVQGIHQNEWRIKWVASRDGVPVMGAVTIYAAGNAADGKNDRFNDHIYTAHLTLSPTTTTAVEASPIPQLFTLDRAYPNPAVLGTTIGYNLQEASGVTLLLYDALGREIRRVDFGMQPSGSHTYELETVGLSAGLYLYELRVADAREVRPLLLMK